MNPKYTICIESLIKEQENGFGWLKTLLLCVYNKVSSSDSELYRQNLEDEKSIPIGSAMTFWLENPNDTLQISFKVKKFYFYLEVYKEDTTKQLEDKTKRGLHNI